MVVLWTTELIGCQQLRDVWTETDMWTGVDQHGVDTWVQLWTVSISTSEGRTAGADRVGRFVARRGGRCIFRLPLLSL